MLRHADAECHFQRLSRRANAPGVVYELIVSGSVEERMLRLQPRKFEVSRTLLGGGGPGVQLSESDLDDLFAPLCGVSRSVPLLGRPRRPGRHFQRL